jgi:hypothetical protein
MRRTAQVAMPFEHVESKSRAWALLVLCSMVQWFVEPSRVTTRRTFVHHTFASAACIIGPFSLSLSLHCTPHFARPRNSA